MKTNNTRNVSSGTRTADGRGAGNGEDSEGPGKDGGTGNLSFSVGTAICEENEVAGSGIALVVFERDFDR